MTVTMLDTIRSLKTSFKNQYTISKIRTLSMNLTREISTSLKNRIKQQRMEEEKINLQGVRERVTEEQNIILQQPGCNIG